MIKKYQLKNGLTVVLVESHKSPVVSVQMWVKTGSADEPPSLRGISHFIEHLVFKGSRKYGVGEIAATVEGSGGELNAYTSFDQTVFYVTISRQFFDTGLEVIGEMMARPSFVEDEVNKEREVVIEEIKRSMDSSHRQASRLLFESLYRRHPYGEPVIGYEEIIRNVSREEIVKFFETRYRAEKMTLLVVGDFSVNEVKARIEAQFSDLNKGRVKTIKRPKATHSKQTRVNVRGTSFKENFLFLAWPAPAADHKDIAALEVLAMILGQGDSSRLNRSLRIDKQLVNYAGSSLFSPIDPGFFAISASLPPGSLKESLDGIGLEIAKVISRPPDQDEMNRAIVNLHSDQYYTLETVDGMARKFGHFEHLFSDYSHFEKFLKQARSTTPEDIQKIAKKYLKLDKAVICALTPEEDRISAEKEIKAWVKRVEFKAKPEKRSDKKKTAKTKLPKDWFPHSSRLKGDTVETITLAGGTKLLLRPNFDTPVFTMRMGFHGGARIENPGEQGITELLSRTWVGATKNLTEPQLMEKIENLAGSISAFGGRNTCGLTVTGLAPFANPLLELFEQVLMEPALSPEIVDRERKMILEQLRVRHDNPAQQTILKFMALLFGDHPYGRDPLGRAETLNVLKGPVLENHLVRMRTQANMTICAVGHFKRDELVSQIEKLVERLPKGQNLYKKLPYHAPVKGLREFSGSAKEQTHLVIGYPGLSFSDPERYALQVLEAVLAGQGGRLFTELRDKNSLAYSVSPLRMEGVEAGYFGAYIGCSPEKGQKAITMLKEQFNLVRDQKISADELARAQRYLIGRHDIDLQRNSTVASALLFDEMYGLELNDIFQYGQKIMAVQSEDVRAVAQRIFSGSEVISAVGPKEPWADVKNTAPVDLNP